MLMGRFIRKRKKKKILLLHPTSLHNSFLDRSSDHLSESFVVFCNGSYPLAVSLHDVNITRFSTNSDALIGNFTALVMELITILNSIDPRTEP